MQRALDRTSAKLAFLCVGSIACSLGCRAFDETLLGGDDGGAGCVVEKPPGRPPGAGGADQPPTTFALRDVSLEQGARWGQVGYDLDDLCTADPDRESECVPPNPGEGITLDGPNGVDNLLGGELIPYANIFLGDIEAPVCAAEELGSALMLVRLERWNGENDDESVTVLVTPAAVGGAAAADGSPPVLPIDGTLPPAPRWDMSDWFWADQAGFVGGDESNARQRDDNAYVAARTIVARIPDRSRFVLAAETFSLELLLSNIVFTARISDDGTTLERAVIAGRWAVADLLTAANSFGFCTATEGSTRLRTFIDLNADVRLVPGSGGAGVPCDATSVGIELTGYAVQWAGLTAAPPLPNACE